MACVAMEEYRAEVTGTEVTFSRVDGAAATVPMDAVKSSETLRNIVASRVGGEYESVVLQLWFPLQLLDWWVQCVRASASDRQQLDGSRFCTLDTPTLVCYAQALNPELQDGGSIHACMQACDYFADEERLGMLCRCLGRRLFCLPPAVAPEAASVVANTVGEVWTCSHVQLPPAQGTDTSATSATPVTTAQYDASAAASLQAHEVLMSLAEGLAVRVLRAAPAHLQLILSVLPPSMHALAMHAEFPDLAANGSLQLDCTKYSLATCTAILELFASVTRNGSGAGYIGNAFSLRDIELDVSGIGCLVLSNNEGVHCNEVVLGFSRALLGCCMLPSSLSLAFQGDNLDLDALVTALATRGACLRSLTVQELPNLYFFSFTRKSRLKKRNEQAELLSRSFSQLSSLRHLCLSSQTKWADNVVHASACWSLSTLTQLTHLCMHHTTSSACAPHWAASVTQCTRLMHLGVCLNLRKCPPDASGHNHTWLGALKSLTSLSLRCADERVSFRNGISFCHGGGEAHAYIASLFTKSLCALPTLRHLHVSPNVITIATLHCIVSNLHSSLRDLVVAMHVASIAHAFSVANILHKATLLTGLGFDYHCPSSLAQGGVSGAEEPHQSLCKHLSCLRGLRRLRLHMHAGPDVPMGVPEDTGAQMTPIGTVSGLLYLNLNTPEFLGGFVATAHAHLTSLLHIEVAMQPHADGSTATECVQFGYIISQQRRLQSLVLRSVGLSAGLVSTLTQSAQNLPFLSLLHIESPHDMSAETVSAFGGFLRCRSALTSLELHIRVSSCFPDVLAGVLTCMQRLQHLSLQLSVQYDQIPRPQSDSVYETLAAVVGSVECLRSIDVCVQSVGLAGAGAVSLAEGLRGCDELHDVTLGNVDISKGLVCALAASATRLRSLKLRGSDMHADAAAEVAGFLEEVPSLRSVTVQGGTNSGWGSESRGSARMIVGQLEDDDPLRCIELREECA